MKKSSWWKILQPAGMPAREPAGRKSRNERDHIGLGIHNKSITFVIKTGKEGELVRQSPLEATRAALTAWAAAIQRPWVGALR